MLSEHQLVQLFAHLGTPEAGQALVLKARKEAPVRQVKSNGSNVITVFASRKMAREVASESRKAEYTAVIEHEMNPDVLEYYPQPCQLKLTLINPDDGEVKIVDHTPDFLVIRGDQIVLQEWKTEEKLMQLARRQPWRCEKQGGTWRNQQIEEQMADIGLVYEIHSAAEIHPNRTKNHEFLADYLLFDAPACPEDVAMRLKAALAEHGAITLGDLMDSPFKFEVEHLHQAIVEGHVFCDLDSALMSNPHDFVVYRDKMIMVFERQMRQQTSDPVRHSFEMVLSQGAQYRIEGQVYSLALIAENSLTFTELDNKKTISLEKGWVLEAIDKGKIELVRGVGESGMDLHRLTHYPERDLSEAQNKHKWLSVPYEPGKTPF